jgi:uncharacterized spore protein YtfJ
MRPRPLTKEPLTMTTSPGIPEDGTALDSILATIERGRDAITARRVFGDPIERDGVTVVPAAVVRGGGGGGGGPDEEGAGGGTGYGLTGRPIGAYVIREGEVRWEPAIDRTRVIVGSQVVVAIALLLLAVVARRRSSGGGRPRRTRGSRLRRRR